MNLNSTSTAAHAWLQANIPTATGLTTFNRVLTGINVPDNFVVVGAVKELKQEWAGFGNGRRDETYLIPCYVRIAGGGDPSSADVDSLYALAWQYANAVVVLITGGLTINGVAGDPTLGGNVIFAQFESGAEVEPAMSNASALEVGVTFDIACRAQVTK